MSDDNPFAVTPASYEDRPKQDRDSSTTAEVSDRTIEILNQTRPWVQLMGILLWIGTAIILLGVVFALLGALNNSSLIPLACGYVLGACLYAALASSLMKYGSKIRQLDSSGAVRDLEEALEAQKTFWRLIGIVTVVVLILYLALMALFFGVLMVGLPMRR